MDGINSLMMQEGEGGPGNHPTLSQKPIPRSAR